MSSKSFTVRLGADVGEYRRAMKEAQGAATDVATTGKRDFQQLGNSMIGLGTSMTKRVTLPLVAVGAGAIKVATDFDSSMTRIQSLVGLGADEVDGMRDSVLQLAGQTATAPGQLADALFFATSAGLEAADAMDAVEWAAKASAVGLGDTSTVVDLTTSAMNAYGAEVLSAEEATDTLTAAVRLGKLEPAQLAGAMGQVLPVASAMGVGFDEVGAAFAAMSRTGTNASQAATQLRGIMSTLLSPSAEARDAMEGVGLSVEGVQQSLRDDGLLATLELLVGSLGDNVTASEAVFGNVRALSGVMDMLGGNVEDTRQIFADMADTAGITSEAFDIAAESAGFKMKQAWADLQVALVQVGDILLPLVSNMAQWVSDLTATFTNLPGPVQTIIVALGGLAAVAGPLLIVGGLLVKNFIAMRAELVKLKGVMLGHPMLMFAAVAVGVGVAIHSIVSASNKAAEQVDNMARAMRDAESAADGFKSVLRETFTESEELRGAMLQAGVTVHEMSDALLEGGDAADEMVGRIRDAGVEMGMSGLAADMMAGGLRDMSSAGIAAIGVNEDLARIEGEVGEAAQATSADFAQLAADQRAQSHAAAEAAEEAYNGAEAQRFLREATQDTAEAIEVSAEVQQAAADVIEAEYDRLEAAADALRNRVDSAMSSAAASVFKFSDDSKKSIGSFRDELAQNTWDLTVWQDNLISIAERGGAEFALQMAEYGPEFAGMISELDGLSDEEFAAVVSEMETATGAMQRNMADEFAKVDPAFKKVLDGVAGMTQLEMIILEMKASQEAFKVGQALASGMEAGIGAGAPAIAAAAVRAVDNAVTAAQIKAETGSPSKLMMREVGIPLGQGVMVGMEKGATDDRDRVVERIIGSRMVGSFHKAGEKSAPAHVPGPTTNNRTGVHVETMVVESNADIDAFYRAANLSMAVA